MLFVVDVLLNDSIDYYNNRESYVVNKHMTTLCTKDTAHTLTPVINRSCDWLINRIRNVISIVLCNICLNSLQLKS